MFRLKLPLAALLLLCLAPMPYGYYQLVRIVAMIAFAIIAYQYYEKRVMPLAITFSDLRCCSNHSSRLLLDGRCGMWWMW